MGIPEIQKPPVFIASRTLLVKDKMWDLIQEALPLSSSSCGVRGVVGEVLGVVIQIYVKGKPNLSEGEESPRRVVQVDETSDSERGQVSFSKTVVS